MVCELYNIVKEGNVRTIPWRSDIELSSESFFALYDGDYSTSALTVSGVGETTLALEVEFGEAYDVCYVDYHTNEPTMSAINITYGTISGTDFNATMSLVSPGVYRGTIEDFTRLINVFHTVSGTYPEVYELEVICQRNETLGFGTSPSTAPQYTHLQHATAETKSAAINTIPLFNASNYNQTAKVAIAPTFTDADNYLFISTSSSGTFYGIDEFGFIQPGPNHIPLTSDDFLSESLSAQWDRRPAAQPHKIVPTKEGLIFDLTYNEPGTNEPDITSQKITGIISKEFFTAYSFTVELDIRFLTFDLTPGIFDPSGRDFFMCLTNSYPIPDVGYTDAYMSDERRGGSVGGVTMRVEGTFSPPDITNLKHSFRYVDGNSSDRPDVDITENRFSGGIGDIAIPGIVGEIDNIVGPSLEEIQAIVNNGVSLGDMTESASWHKWTLVYDHKQQKLSGYVDKVFLGSRIFRVEPFKEACKLFIGFLGNGGVRWQIRNFKFLPDVLYKQKNVAHTLNGGIATATISGTFAPRINDGNSSTNYVAPNPTSLTTVRIDLDAEYDVVNYKIKQRDLEDSISAYGKTYYPDYATVALVDFGGKAQYVHTYAVSSDFVTKAPTYSGTATTVSGVGYLSFQFTTYDRTDLGNGALVINEIEINSEGYFDAESPAPESSRLVPWVEGRWHNLKQYGQLNALSIKDKVSPEASYYPFPEYFLKGVDYDVISAVNGRQFADVEDYHHSETLFSHPFPIGFAHNIINSYTEWHSGFSLDRAFWIWRVFPEKSKVKAIYWDSRTGGRSNVADKFKFQYLIEGGSPHNEADWRDVPPIAITHPHTNTTEDNNYKQYRDYLIVNNDGEFYTDYFLLPDGVNFSIGIQFITYGIPKGLVVPKNYGFGGQLSTATGVYPSQNGLTGYVEFDEAVSTRGIRMVIKDPIESGAESGLGFSSTPGEAKFDIALKVLHIFRENGAGSYISPVFDTGTPQNTERIKTLVKSVEGSSFSTFVRSYPDPPKYLYNKYEFWENYGQLGNSDVSVDSSFVDPFNRVIVYNDEIIFIRGDGNGQGVSGDAEPRVYNYILDSWSSFPDYSSFPESVGDTLSGDSEVPGTVGARSGVGPDGTVDDYLTLLGDTLYVAAVDKTTISNSRIIRCDLSQETRVWEILATTRDPLSENASMVGYNDRLYFFNRDGAIVYFDIPKNNWVRLSTTIPTFGTNRRWMASTLYNGKIYLFGGLIGGVVGSNIVTIFDPSTETVEAGTPSPYPIRGCQAVFVPEEKVIYILPQETRSNPEHAVQKYYPEEDRWEVCESLMWARDNRGEILNTNSFYYYYGGYIWGVYKEFGFNKARVIRDPWVPGKMPDFRDPVWGGIEGVSNIPWKEVESLGELMPQNRYFQFKVEMYSDDRENSPVLESVRIITPQEVVVPASGVENIYVKVGVSSELTFQSWYTGERLDEPTLQFDRDYSILYTQSSDGLSWSFPAAASGVQLVSDDYAFTVSSPWVIKESISSYKFWFTRERIEDGATPPSIWYASSSIPSDISTGNDAEEVIPANVISQTSKGVYQPCVIKNSPTSYDMWFSGKDSSSVPRIFYASSVDGVAWTSHQKVIDIGRDTNNQYDSQSVFRPSVIFVDGLYRMWYTGTGEDGVNRVLYTESSDKINWTFPLLSVDAASQGELDQLGCFNPFVLKDADTYYIYYFGFSGQENFLIRAASVDGFTWANFSLVMSAYGISGDLDGSGVIDFFALVNRDAIVPRSMITTGKLKVHN